MKNQHREYIAVCEIYRAFQEAMPQGLATIQRDPVQGVWYLHWSCPAGGQKVVERARILNPTVLVNTFASVWMQMGLDMACRCRKDFLSLVTQPPS